MPRSTARSASRPSRLLRTYSGKRDFTRTAEPKPAVRKARAKALQFVVQKHDARRLHFDLRLELDGVLKSWAVTKGPSMRAGVRRLAVQTEDHPIDYLEWEGVIPKGQYGGGTMIVWDRGIWAPEGNPQASLKAGKLSFTLSGKRLNGRWTLVRMKSDGKSKRQNWLLIKGHDAHALKGDDPEPVEKAMISAVSGLTNQELAQKETLRPDHRARARKSSAVATAGVLTKLPGAKKAILPVFVAPSLAVSAAEPPDGPEWLHEIKHDGYRVQARIDGGRVNLLTRKGLDWTRRFPTVAKALESLPVQAALIDGEIIVQDQSGQSSFSDLQSDLKAGRHDRVVYYVFDLLYCNGIDLRGVALKERKRVLAEIIAVSPASFMLRYNDHVDVGGDTILTQACKLGLEGIVSKREDLAYVSGRGEHWVKSKCMLRQEFVVVGFVPSAETRNAIGSLVLAYYETGELVHAGRAGTGFSREEALSLHKVLQPRSQDMPKFRKMPAAAALKDVVWVRPELVAEIEYRGWSADGLLRQAAYKGLREDKPATEIGLESAVQSVPARHSPPEVSIKLTHPERKLWEEEGITKQALADFYSRIGEWILPHVTGRVLSLVRCPQGQGGTCFFAKHAWMGISDAVRLVDTGDDKPMLAIDGLEGLLSLVQMNVLEIHVWGSRVKDLERPDRMVFDLDPGEGVTWADVRKAALELRQRLETAALRSFVKTTGGKGLHVVVPLQPKADWDEVKAFSKAFAELMAADSPGRYVATMSKSRRRGRIFIDYLRNGRGATAIAAYSTRARPGAPVSVPVDWSELSDIASSDRFTVETLEHRLTHLQRDPWMELSVLKQKLPK
jgi:bifunctional non-homologous end joining protein LigD